MKRKVGKEPEWGTKKRKEVGNDNNSLASMFAKQKAACELNKERLAYSAQLQKGKGMGLDEAAQVCSHDDRHEWIWYWSSGRSEGANSGICQRVEELPEEDTVKEHCRCNPREQERTVGHPIDQNLLSTINKNAYW